MLSESQIQKTIIDFLSYHENRGALTFIRNNSFSGTVQRRNGSTGYVKNSKAGSPDIIVVRNGVALGLEVKSAKGKLSPEQERYKLLWEKCGGLYYVVRSIEDVSQLLFPG